VSNVIRNGAQIKYVPLAALACVAFLLLWKHALPRYLAGKWKLVGNAAPLALLLLATPVMYTYEATLTAAGIKAVGSMPAGLPTPSPPWPPGQAGSTADCA
jgi:MFS superfamily sulfate permease-like transporter